MQVNVRAMVLMEMGVKLRVRVKTQVRMMWMLGVRVGEKMQNQIRRAMCLSGFSALFYRISGSQNKGCIDHRGKNNK